MCFPLGSSTYLPASMNVAGRGYGSGLPRPASAPEMAQLATHCGSPTSAFLPVGLPRPSSAPDMTCLRRTSASSASSYFEAESDANGSPAPSPKTWRVVWCHERCHKPDNEERRMQLNEATGTAGASLVCLKKASKYADWLRKGQRPAYILLTDWREVKPCLGFASQVALSNQPTFTVVLCEEQSHFDRAQAWAEALPPRADPVHICKDLKFLEAFLNKYSARTANGVSTPRTQLSFATDPAAHQRNFQFNCQDSSLLLATMPQAQQSLQIAWQRQTSGDAWPQTSGAVVPPATMMHEAPRVAPLPQQTMPPAMTPRELERVLRAAAPDKYED